MRWTRRRLLCGSRRSRSGFGSRPMGAGEMGSTRVERPRLTWPIVAVLLVVAPLAATWAPPTASGASEQTVSIGDASVVEGTAHSRNLVFAVTLSGPSASTVAVDYSITGNDAVGGN